MTRPLALVTGGAGWLGARLVEALSQGLPDAAVPGGPWRVRALVHGAGTDRLDGLANHVEIRTGDLRNAEDCRSFCRDAEGAVLFHTAGVIHPARVRDFYAVNVDGTRNVLAAAAAAGVRRTVVVSSNSPFGFNPSPDHRFDERSAYNPYQHYGRSKMQMELAVREAGKVSALETVIVRAPWFYGPGQPARQTTFFTMIRDGKVPIVGPGDKPRSMAYLDNLCQGLLLGATKAAPGSVYWVADARPYTMNEVVDTIEQVLEQDFGIPCARRRRRLPDVLSNIAQVADGMIQGAGLYQQEIHVLSEMNKSIACDVSAARRELAYEPRVDLREGMRRSIEWCLAAGQLERRA